MSSSPSPASSPSPPESHDPAAVKYKLRISPRDMRASSDMHTEARPSCLSSEAPAPNFRGLYNLGGLALLVMNARLVVENLLKYGIRIRINLSSEEDPEEWTRLWPILACLASLLGFVFLAHCIEWVAWHLPHRVSRHQAGVAHVVLDLVVFFVPMFVISWTHAHIMPGIMLLFNSLTITLKLISYAHVNHDLRRELIGDRHAKSRKKKSAGVLKAIEKDSTLRQRKGGSVQKQEQEQEPEQEGDADDADDADPTRTPPTFGHLLYFVFAPTLCYQPVYPRTARIRWRFVARRVLEIAFCLTLIYVIAEQYVRPLVTNYIKFMDEHPADPIKRTLRIAERMLKLAVPNSAIWLLGFYCFFHSYLNLTGELLRFSDRLFYRAWWNAESLDVYWRTWNLPVHNWLVRHVYGPALRRGISTLTAQGVVFFFSAVMHEVLIGVPCHVFRLWAFLGILGQVPLIVLTRWIARKLKKPVWGNVIFWATFLVFGQPLMILFYAHDYIRQEALPTL